MSSTIKIEGRHSSGKIIVLVDVPANKITGICQWPEQVKYDETGIVVNLTDDCAGDCLSIGCFMFGKGIDCDGKLIKQFTSHPPEY